MKKSMFWDSAAFVLILILGSAHSARCAESEVEDPFGAALAAPAAPAAPAEPAKDQSAPVPEEKDLVVRTVRATNPTRPDELIWAARTVLDVGRPDEAKQYLRQVLDRLPNAPTLAALNQEFGSALFVRFTGEEQLQPEGQQVAQAVLDATLGVLRDPQRLEDLIAKLSDVEPQTRRMALTDLRESGDAAAVALIRVLADPQRAAQQSVALQALAALGSVAEGPLLGAMQAPESDVRRQAITALGLMKSRAAIGFLLRPLLEEATPPDMRRACAEAVIRIVGAVPQITDVQRYLTREVHRHLAGQSVGMNDEQGMTTVWMWDDQQRTSAARPMTEAAASRWMAQRLAQELHELWPQSAESRKLLLITLLEWAKVDVGMDAALSPGQASVSSQAAAEGTAAVEEALAFAMETGHVSAAIGALEVLRDIGDERLLAGGGGALRPVAQALRHSDPQVRFAAANAIITWDPASPYTGSSHLVEALAFFAKSAGVLRALVGHPQRDLAQNLAGTLAELGFEADIASTGDGLVKQAFANPDYELILVSDAIDAPPVKELVQRLRCDARTARQPIGILTREANLPEMERFAEEDHLTKVFPRAHDTAGVMVQVRRLLELKDPTAISADVRLQWAETALDYFARVAGDTRHYLFPEVFAQEATLIEALSLPALSDQAAQILGTLGSPGAQRALVWLASQSDRSLLQRHSAAAAFALAVERRGLLLSRPEILTQYYRYNRSEDLDRDTQKVLGAILDSIEAPSQPKQ